MKYREGRVLETLQSVQAFPGKNSEVLGAINTSGARKTIDSLAAELRAHAVQQDGGQRKAMGETENQRVPRSCLPSAALCPPLSIMLV
ncbi:hypothetical protein PLCT1_01598 [Planctomycetaceae bacterium]|nr:hypothetical protein PLCT1_01598 [Planctomycetaceae bacterium]